VAELGGAVAAPAGRVRDEQRPHGRSGLKPVAVFRFLSENWSPWIALVRMRERWPGLRFEMKAGYIQELSLSTRITKAL
jgi:hypothetical protein